MVVGSEKCNCVYLEVFSLPVDIILNARFGPWSV